MNRPIDGPGSPTRPFAAAPSPWVTCAAATSGSSRPADLLFIGEDPGELLADLLVGSVERRPVLLRAVKDELADVVAEANDGRPHLVHPPSRQGAGVVLDGLRRRRRQLRVEVAVITVEHVGLD